MEFLARLEADGFARWNIHLLSSSWVPADARLAGLHIKHAKAAKFDSLSTPQGVLHGFENSLDSLFCLGPGNICLRYNRIHDIELDHGDSR